MSRPNDTQNWRTRFGWLVRPVIRHLSRRKRCFCGGELPRNVEPKRRVASGDGRNHHGDGALREASVQFADAFNAATERWAAATAKVVGLSPGYYRIPGAAHPPTAIWNTARSQSGICAYARAETARWIWAYCYEDGVARRHHDTGWRLLNFGYRTQFTGTEDSAGSCWWAGWLTGRIANCAPDFSRAHGPAKRIRRRPAQADQTAHELRVRLEALPVSK